MHWHPQSPLLWFDELNALTLGESTAISITGSPSSGKTSAIIANIVLSMLMVGYGFLVVCVKRNQAAQFTALAKLAKREADIIHFSLKPDAQGRLWRCNIMAYLVSVHGEGAVEEIVQLLHHLMQFVEARHADANQQQFWDRSSTILARYSILLLIYSGITLSFEALYRLITSLPNHPDMLDDIVWQKTSFYYKVRESAEKYATTPEQQRKLAVVTRYFTQFMYLAERTRTSIIITLSSMLDMFLTGMLNDLYCTDTTFTPDDLNDGKLIIMDMPINAEGGRTAQIAQFLFKYLSQKFLLRREIHENTPYVCILADEAHRIVSSLDYLLLAEGRESRVSMVYSTQTLDQYYAALQGNRDAAEALLNLFTLHIFAANSGNTNRFASQLIGQDERIQHGWQVDSRGGIGISGSSQPDNIMPPWVFSQLRKGGSPSWVTECIIYRNGRAFSTGQQFLRVVFPQIINGQRPAMPQVTPVVFDSEEALEPTQQWINVLSILLSFLENFFILKDNPALLLHHAEEEFAPLPNDQQNAHTPIVDIPASQLLFSPAHDDEAQAEAIRHLTSPPLLLTGDENDDAQEDDIGGNPPL
ncbi:MAG: type IV secretory system conjugative DNA transfer family protein [Chloroflexota bacterium]